MIRFFVSSTFRDMHYERDTINDVVLPQIKSLVNKYGESAEFVDLRWGIDTTNTDFSEGIRKILSVCMQEIEQSFPYFIIMLGDCYGSVPDSDIIDEFLCSPVGTEFNEKEINGKSITELEIIHAIEHLASSYEGDISDYLIILLRDSMDVSLMSEESKSRYMPASQKDKAQVAELRERLEARYPSSVIRYSTKWDRTKDIPVGYEEFAGKLTDKITKCLKNILPKEPFSEEEVLWMNDEILRKNVEERLLLLDEEKHYYTEFLLKTVQNNDSKTFALLIYGSHGSGTSTHAYAVNQLARDAGFMTVHVTCSPLYDDSLVSEILKRMIWRVEEKMSSNHRILENASAKDCRKCLETLVNQSEKPILFILDAIDSIEPKIRKQLLYSLPVSGKCSYLFTAMEVSSLTYKLPNGFHLDYYGIAHNSVSYYKALIQKESQATRKEYSDYMIDLVSSVSFTKSPLYMKLLLAYVYLKMNAKSFDDIAKNVKNTNGAEKIYLYIQEIIQDLPENEKDLAKVLLYEAGSGMSSNFIPFLTQILNRIPAGLRKTDILQIYHKLYPNEDLTLLDLTILFHKCEILFREASHGRIHFIHNLIEALNTNSPNTLKAICDYLSELPNDDPVKLREYIPACIGTDQYSHAVNYLLEIQGEVDEQEMKLLLSHEELSSAIDHSKQRLLVQSWSIALKSYPELSKKNPATIVKHIIEAFRSMVQRDNYRNKRRSLVNIFLFTFDTFFSNLSTEDQNSIMQELHNYCMDYLFRGTLIPDESDPNHMERLIDLRTVYVCMEQCGIRADSYEKQKYFYNQFWQMCKDSLEQLPDNHPLYLTVLKDLQKACEKMASLRGVPLEHKLAFFTYANEQLCQYEATHNCNLSFEYICNHFTEAQLIAEDAFQKIQIGWSENVLETHQEFIEKSMREMLEYCCSQESSTLNYNRQCSAYRTLSDLERYKENGNKNLEINLCRHFIHTAEEGYDFNGDVYFADQIRNGYLRLALYNSKKDLYSAFQYMLKSYEQITIMRKELPKERYRSILFMTLKESLKILMQILESSENDLSRVTRLCNNLWNMIDDEDNRTDFLTDLYLTYDEEEQLIKAMYHKFVAATLDLVVLCQKEALKMAQAERFKEAIELCDLITSLATHIKPNYESNDAFWNLLRKIDSFQGTVWHNYRAYVFRTNGNWDIEADQESYYQNKSCFDSIMEQYLKGKITRNLLDALSHDSNLSNALLMSASYFWDVTKGKEEEKEKRIHFFRNLLKEKYYRLPGQGTWYYTTFVSEYDKYADLLNPIGHYLCQNLEDLEILKLLESSDLFETLTLEYAYKNNRVEDAHKIIANGYLNYLELPMLITIFRYDRKKYNQLFPDLRAACIKNLERSIKHFQKWIGSYAELILKDCKELKHAKMEKYAVPLRNDIRYSIVMEDTILEKWVALVQFTSEDGKIWRLTSCNIHSGITSKSDTLLKLPEIDSYDLERKKVQFRKCLKKTTAIISKYICQNKRNDIYKEDLHYLIAKCMVLEKNWSMRSDSKDIDHEKYEWAEQYIHQYGK